MVWRSAFGLVVMFVLAWLLGGCRRIAWRPVLVGIGLQFAIALVMLQTSPGLAAINQARNVCENVLDSVDSGCEFAFGDGFREHFFAFKIVPTIIFMGALMSLLYHYGILQRVVGALGWVMQRLMGTSGAESLCAAANIFLGQTEAPLVVRPYLDRMTTSEMLSVMITGFSTIAGGVMAAFIGMGVDVGHLLTASVITAPAGLVVAKLMHPEDAEPLTHDAAHAAVPVESVNGLDALSRGASEGLQLGINVLAMIVAFLAMVTLADHTLQWATQSLDTPWTLSDILGWACAPFAWLMGVTPGEERQIGELLGLKLVTNEFLAYQKLITMIEAKQLGERSQLVAIYALCGFANLGSIGVQIGGLSQLVPHRRSEISRLAFRAMLGGNLACFMTACIAGILTPS